MKPSQRRRGCNRSKLAPSHRHFLCRISVPAPSCRLHPAGAGHDTLTRKSRKAAGHAGKRLGQSVPRSWLACPARIRGLSLPGQMSHRQNSKWRIEEGAWTSRHITHPLQQVRTDTNLTPRLIVAVALWVGVLNPVHVRGGPSMRVQGLSGGTVGTVRTPPPRSLYQACTWMRSREWVASQSFGSSRSTKRPPCCCCPVD